MTEDDLQTIRRHREGPVLRLTLDRPEVLNA
ncbi:MAG: enoyl-CoA hydratase, partial [Deltaproteobacteria bacterium]|nr:enoyl-CoA hydratase [Deltaproteobacteria bacterium]